MTDRLRILEDLRARVREAEGGFGDAEARRHVPTGIAALDGALPGGGLPAGALVEILEEEDPSGAWTLACIAAREAARDGGVVFWIEAARRREKHHHLNRRLCDRLYPRAAVALGLDPARLLVVRAGSAADAFWAFDQAIRSRGVAASIASLRGLGAPETRRLQLAAEKGGGLAILVRPEREAAVPSTAAVRLRVRAAASPGEPDLAPALGPRRFAVEVARARGGFPAAAVEVALDDESGEAIGGDTASRGDTVFREDTVFRGNTSLRGLPGVPAALRGPGVPRRRSASA
ncbi:MAG TPA: hypothetical protein VKE69_07765 [Planctomycetota bacterium]|nr:hypothetical protein [Planctomycetota bacterium]